MTPKIWILLPYITVILVAMTMGAPDNAPEVQCRTNILFCDVTTSNKSMSAGWNTRCMYEKGDSSLTLVSNAAYYIYPCARDDPDLEPCLTYAANHLASHFKEGIPELGVAEVEPIILDEIQIALGSGPDGYRAIFRDIHAYGVSNMTVTSVRTDLDNLQFQLSFFIPKIMAEARYRSSGTLIMIKASGGGNYWGEYESVRAKVYFRAQPHQVGDHVYLSVEEIKMDFSVQSINMGIKDLHNGNTVLEGALNLMINTHSQELLKEMKPSLRRELTEKMRLFTANLLARIPYDSMITT